jgi:hypothetical protein
VTTPNCAVPEPVSWKGVHERGTLASAAFLIFDPEAIFLSYDVNNLLSIQGSYVAVAQTEA